MDDRSFLILQNETRILEKKKSDLQSELERLNAVKGEELRQHNLIIQTLKDTEVQLEEQVKLLRGGILLLTESYTVAKLALEKILDKTPS